MLTHIKMNYISIKGVKGSNIGTPSKNRLKNVSTPLDCICKNSYRLHGDYYICNYYSCIQYIYLHIYENFILSKKEDVLFLTSNYHIQQIYYFKYYKTYMFFLKFLKSFNLKINIVS